MQSATDGVRLVNSAVSSVPSLYEKALIGLPVSFAPEYDFRQTRPPAPPSVHVVESAPAPLRAHHVRCCSTPAAPTLVSVLMGVQSPDGAVTVAAVLSPEYSARTMSFSAVPDGS